MVSETPKWSRERIITPRGCSSAPEPGATASSGVDERTGRKDRQHRRWVGVSSSERAGRAQHHHGPDDQPVIPPTLPGRPETAVASDAGAQTAERQAGKEYTRGVRDRGGEDVLGEQNTVASGIRTPKVPPCRAKAPPPTRANVIAQRDPAALTPRPAG